jgi:hypothetical protein
MSPYIQRAREAKPDDDDADDVPRLRAKQYMDKFINPPEYLEAQRKKKEDEKKKARRRFPERAAARRAGVPDRATRRSSRGSATSSRSSATRPTTSRPRP